MGEVSILQDEKSAVLVAVMCLLTTFIILSSAFIAPVGAGTYGTKQITDNDYDEYNANVEDGVIVWRWWDGADNEISFYDIANEKTTRITDNTYSDYNPQIDEGVIVWQWWDTTDEEISFYDISSGKTTRITDNTYSDYNPQIDEGVIVWQWTDTTDWDSEISLYDVSTGDTTRITDNAYSDYGLQIDSGIVVWHGYDGADYEIFFYDIASEETTRITDNTYNDYYPQTDSGIVTWRAAEIPAADYEIFLYDISSQTATQITNNTYGDYDPRIDGEVIVWRGYDTTANYEIFLYEIAGQTTIQITSNTYADDSPRVDSGVVVWMIYDGADYEIFLTMVDINPPVTSISLSGTPGDNEWWTSDVAVVLEATDLETPGGPTYYRLGEGAAWIPYTTGFNVTTEGTNTLQYYSVDQSTPPNIEPEKQRTIKIDKTLPNGTITIEEGASETRSTSVTLTLSATDTISGVAQMRFSEDESTWTSWEEYVSSKSWSLPGGDGTKTVYVQFMDNAGLTSQTFQDSITLNTSPIGGPGYIEEALLGVAIAAIAVGGIVIYKLRKRPKKPSAPTQMRIQAEPAKIVADGKSASTLIIQLLDKTGKPIAASEDTEVRLATTGGKIDTPLVRIPKGSETGKTVLVSSKESGTVELSAEAKGLKSVVITLEFMEKPRFCMGCGTRMSVKDKRCRKCGAAPEQFTGPAKICRNCERMGKTTYIPQTAEFCSECGASQPR